MVIYDLICPWGHRFEGWFPSADAYETQSKQGLVPCEICGNTRVSKLPSGGHRRGSVPSERPAPSGDQTPLAFSGPLDQVTLLKAVRHYVQSHFEDVGDRFAALARQVHFGKAPPKSIFGKVSKEEQEKLAEDEIPYFVLPSLPHEYDN